METWPSGLRQQVANLSYAVMRTVSSNLTVSANTMHRCQRGPMDGIANPESREFESHPVLQSKAP